MMTVLQSRAAWTAVRKQIVQSGDPRGLRVPRGVLPHPRDAGARPTTTWPVGQVADYSIDDLPGEPPLVVREFADRFEAFIDGAQLTTRVIAAVEHDPSKAMYFGAALLGGAIGSSVSNKREGVLLGAGLGLLFAALLDSSINEGTATRARSGK